MIGGLKQICEDVKAGIRWLEDRAPTWCPRCGKYRPAKDMRTVHHRTAGPIDVCKSCFYDLHPDQKPRVDDTP